MKRCLCFHLCRVVHNHALASVKHPCIERLQDRQLPALWEHALGIRTLLQPAALGNLPVEGDLQESQSKRSEGHSQALTASGTPHACFPNGWCCAVNLASVCGSARCTAHQSAVVSKSSTGRVLLLCMQHRHIHGCLHERILHESYCLFVTGECGCSSGSD